jgi:hypothetical protein
MSKRERAWRSGSRPGVDLLEYRYLLSAVSLVSGVDGSRALVSTPVQASSRVAAPVEDDSGEATGSATAAQAGGTSHEIEDEAPPASQAAPANETPVPPSPTLAQTDNSGASTVVVEPDQSATPWVPLQPEASRAAATGNPAAGVTPSAVTLVAQGNLRQEINASAAERELTGQDELAPTNWDPGVRPVAPTSLLTTGTDFQIPQPLGSDILADFLPFDPAGLATAVDHLLEKLDDWATGLSWVEDASEMIPEPVIWAAGIIAVEMGRRWWRRSSTSNDEPSDRGSASAEVPNGKGLSAWPSSTWSLRAPR